MLLRSISEKFPNENKSNKKLKSLIKDFSFFVFLRRNTFFVGKTTEMNMALS